MFYFSGPKVFLQAQNCQNPLHRPYSKLLTRATAIQGSEEKTCVYSKEEKTFMERGAGDQRSFHHSQVKHTVMEVQHPLNGVIRSFWAALLACLLSLQEWEHSAQFLCALWAQGVSVAAHVQDRATRPTLELLLCSTSSTPPCTHPIPITAPQRRREEGECAPLQTENKDKKTCKIVY